MVDDQLGYLIQLQKLDDVINSLYDKQRKIPMEIERLKRELDDSETVLKEFRKRLETVELKRRSKEKDIEANNGRKVKAEGKLYQVKTNKEYQVLLSETEELNHQNLQLEEEILELMEELDTLRTDLNEKEKEFQEEIKQNKQDRLEKKEYLRKLNEELENRLKERGSAAQHLDDRLVARYQRIAAIRKNAVVPIRHESCSGCFMRVRPALLAKIKLSEMIISCDNCARILYYSEEESE